MTDKNAKKRLAPDPLTTPLDDDPPPTELSAESEAIDTGLNDSDLGAEATGGMASQTPPGSPGPQTPSSAKKRP